MNAAGVHAFSKSLEGNGCHPGAMRRILAMSLLLATATLAAPIASADFQLPYLGEDPGPCGEPCLLLPPLNQDPLPIGKDTTKLQVGGDCPAGSYGIACETSQCMGTWWVRGACNGTTTCTVYARTTCMNGNNQGKIWWFGVNRFLQDRGLGREAPHVYVPEAAVGGNCDDHPTAVACNYHTRPTDHCYQALIGPEVTCPSDIFCTAYALGDCQYGQQADGRESITCFFTRPQCYAICRILTDWSVTICP